MMADESHWKLTGELRWRRPSRGNDSDVILEQRWEETMTGEKVWRPVPKMMED